MEQLKFSLYNYNTVQLCPNHILTEFIYSKLLNDFDSAWHFRKHFTIQLALTSLMSYLFSTGIWDIYFLICLHWLVGLLDLEKRNPFNFAFSPSNAQIHLSEFLPRMSFSLFFSCLIWNDINIQFRIFSVRHSTTIKVWEYFYDST